ncbi:MAG: diaminopimelate epimerase [Synergistaceae bacterium]|nr:diaminopimelate epimerase [Synergistaceae bacterium]
MIPFMKMHGNGNDFIVIDDREGVYATDELAEMARRYCERRSSLGADGILLVESDEGADYRMRLFNADGSEGEMCGNGARCIARYAFHKGIAGAEQTFSTLAGVMRASVDPPFVDLDMGVIPLSGSWFNHRRKALDRVFRASFMTVGVPHLVLFLEGAELSREEMISAGRELRYNADLFPRGANVSFVEGIDGARIKSVTYERGVEDLTDSCGTGSTASAIAWVMREGGPVSSASIEVTNPGGINGVTLSFDRDGKSVSASLRGRTAMVAEGVLF